MQRFGFLNCHSETSNSSSSSSREHQYVHCTGAVFVLFSCTTTRSRSRVTSMSKGRASGRYSVHADIVPSPHEAYITRHVSGKNKDDYDNCRKVSFLLFPILSQLYFYVIFIIFYLFILHFYFLYSQSIET